MDTTLPSPVGHPPLKAVPLLAGSTLGFMLAHAVAVYAAPVTAQLTSGVATVALLAGLCALAVSGRLLHAPPLVWIMLFVSLPVAARVVLLGGSHGSLALATPLAGAVVGLYLVAAFQAGFVVESPAEPIPSGVWGTTVSQARAAHAELLKEMKAHALTGPVVVALQEKSGTLLSGVERTAGAWARLERNAAPSLLTAVEAQVAQVAAQLESTSDPMSRAEYQRTAEALTGQLEAIHRIRRNGERALARSRCQVALLETARLSVMAYAAQERSAQGDGAEHLAMLLENATRELDVTAGALEEAQGAALVPFTTRS